jgi:hypothetical protein
LRLRSAVALLPRHGKKDPGGTEPKIFQLDAYNYLPANYGLTLEQKRKEIELADLTLIASRYVEATIGESYPHKDVARAPYGIDVEFWTPVASPQTTGAAAVYIRGKRVGAEGVALLMEAWSKPDCFRCGMSWRSHLGSRSERQKFASDN